MRRLSLALLPALLAGISSPLLVACCLAFPTSIFAQCNTASVMTSQAGTTVVVFKYLTGSPSVASQCR